MAHAGDSPILLGDKQMFLAADQASPHGETATVISDLVIAVEVFKLALQQNVPEGHPKRKELEQKAFQNQLRSKADGDALQRRYLEPVMDTQHKASFEARYQALANVDFFKDVAEKDRFLLSRVASEAEVVEFRLHDFIYHRGDPGNYLLVVISGDVHVLCENGERMDIRHSNRKNGYVLGQMGFFAAQNARESDISVISDSLVALKLTRKFLASVFEPSHTIWTTFAEKSRLYDHIKNAGKPDTDAVSKLASFVVGSGPKKLTVAPCGSIIKTKGKKNKVAPMPVTNGFAEQKPGAEEESKSTSVKAEGEISGQESTNSSKELSIPYPSHVWLRRNESTRRLCFSEEDLLNMVNNLTFYPLSLDHLSVIREVFDAYKSGGSNSRSNSAVSISSDSDSNETSHTGNGHQEYITESGLRAMLLDSGVKYNEGALQDLLNEWHAGSSHKKHTWIADETCISFTSFVSIIGAAIKREHLEHDVEATFQAFIDFDEIMREKITQGDSLGLQGIEKWDELTKLGVGVYPHHIKKAWSEFLDVDISDEACQEMVFEADFTGDGFVSFRKWLDTIHTVHHCELESAEPILAHEGENAVREATATAKREFARSKKRSLRLSRLKLGKRQGSSFRRPKSN